MYCCENDLCANFGMFRCGPHAIQLKGKVTKLFSFPCIKSKPIRLEFINLNPCIKIDSALGRRFCSTAFRLLLNRISVNGIFTGQTSTHFPQSVDAKLKCEKSLNPRKNGVNTDPIGPL